MTEAKKVNIQPKVIAIPFVLILELLIWWWINSSNQEKYANQTATNNLVNFVSPSPSPQPSGRALKVAGYSYTVISDETKRSLKQKSQTDDDFVAIRKFALWLDNNPEQLAYFEALVSQDLAEKSKPVYNYTYETQQPSIDTSNLESALKKQQDALDDLKNKQEDLESDMRLDCMMNGGVAIGNKCY